MVGARSRGVRAWIGILTAAAAAALGAPAAAVAQPTPPEPGPIALAGRPWVVRGEARTLTLYLRLDRPLARRFDGEIRATADVAGRRSSLARLGRHTAGTACYSAVVPAAAPGAEPADEWRAGALVDVALMVDDAPAPSIATRTRVREARPREAAGLPPGC
jgi:hypothetical protein